MGRHSGSPSYGHKCCKWGDDDYEISWLADRYYVDSRLRYPRQYRRFTDAAGALRFCDKWDVTFPEGT